MLKNIKTAGELQESRFVTGIISDLDHYLDSCSVSINGGTPSPGVPIFYHCNPDAEETGTGALKGGSWGFANGDEVVVLVQSTEKYVIGHKGGARPCVPCLLVFSSQSGEEAIAWDIVNDELVVDKKSFSSVCADLSEWGLSVEECVNENLVEQSYCYEDFTEGQLFFKTSDDLPQMHVEPVYENDITPCADFPYVQWNVRLWLDTLLRIDIEGNYVYGRYQPYFVNPVTEREQEPRVGMWIAHADGTVQSDVYWNYDRWGDVPVSAAQEEYIGGIQQGYYHFRSIFDCKFNSEYFSLYPSNLSLGASLIHESLVDGTFQEIYSIVEDVWVESGYSESLYDDIITMANREGINFAILHNPMIDSTTGLATMNESSLLFEWVGVYPNIYDFYYRNQIFSAEMLEKYKQEFRVYYRHPYFKKNFDKVLFNRVNKVREDNGLETMELNENLYRGAKIFADDMADRQSGEPEHIGSDGSKIGDRADAGGYGLYTHGPTYNQEEWEQNLFERTNYPLENAAVTSCGFPWHIHKIVDGGEMGVEETVTSIVTEVPKTVEGDGWQIGHTLDGQELTVTGEGWVNSPGHLAAMTYEPLVESAVASNVDENGTRYISNTFGVIGDASNFDDKTDINWPGFSQMDGTNLINYVMENFIFSKDNGDERRIPKIYLCTIGEE